MYFNDRDWGAALIAFGIMCAVIGWGVIEFVLWIISHISFSWN